MVEAVEQRLNPFKKTPMELVMSSFYQKDLRDVRVEVTIDAPVAAKVVEETFTATLTCYWQIGDGYYGDMQNYDTGDLINSDDQG